MPPGIRGGKERGMELEAFGMMEFVGTAVLDTIGLVIANLDDTLRDQLGVPDHCRALGLIGSRTGAAGQAMAADEAVKGTNCLAVSVELPRDTKGWGGHGCLIVLGAPDVSDARRAVEIALDLIGKFAGEVHISAAGHLEFAYSARAGEVLRQAFGAVEGMAFGFMAGSPAPIGLVMADRAMKAAPVQAVKVCTPSRGTSHSNEVILAVSGEAEAVRQCVMAGKTAGMALLRSMGSQPESPGAPYLV